MKEWFIYTIGFLAQILFSLRSLLQWLSTEKKRKVMIPNTFWMFSLIGSFLLFIYGYFRTDFAIMLGQSLTYFIYIRNLQIQQQWEKIPQLIRSFLFIIPVGIVIFYFNNNQIDIDLLFKNDEVPPWLLILGIVAQIIFTFRFIYQWLYAEHKKQSFLPLGFWLLSLTGAGLILTYAIFRKDPVLIVGHLFGIIIYSRNAYFIRINKT
ncbi:MAG: lauroyl acyltransferase [Winogradskyella sp.]|nr:lauroyl acyltransferase [Winogradskyella sp.]NNF86184.1 lauroyl acyltransferase [Winogradskyella sp.]